MKNINEKALIKVLFVNAHPDDVEFTSASTCQQAIELGWDVYQLLLTSDEYGTKRNDFKGKRIRKVRIHEMEEAAKMYGTNMDGSSKLKLIWFGEIDGYLPFNRDIFMRLKKKIEELKPTIVIGPDSFFSIDLHPDHKHAGWLIYLAVKAIKPSTRPLLLLYHSYNTNFYVPIKNLNIQVDSWAKHKSQTTPMMNKMLIYLRKCFYNLRRTKTGPCLAEGFRRVNFNKDETKIKKLSHKIIYNFVSRYLKGYSKERYYPTPNELGLNFKISLEKKN